MANSPKISNEAASAEADATTALLANGYLRIYDGTQPSTADTAVSGQTLLAELRFGSPAFGAASNGVATANAITADSSANATGTATWFRALKSNGTSPVFDGSVGTSDADLVLNSVAIAVGAEVAVTALTYTRPKS
jgi:hypothetical protein